MSKKLLEMEKVFDRDEISKIIANQWDTFSQQRQPKVSEWTELRNYIFATDTTTTSNSDLPWKNSTTLPKICQIRDNLHSNYVSALFPNDDWLRWEGYKQGDAQKAEKVEAYMSNKTRVSHFRTEMSKLLYDYIDYGNAFATVAFEDKRRIINGEEVTSYVGPVVKRISPLDIVFNPLASDFGSTFKIVRSVVTLGEIKKMVQDEPDNEDLASALEKRSETVRKMGAYSLEDWAKYQGFYVDGFGSIYEYYTSGYVELLEFYGDLHDPSTGEIKEDRIITIMDRSHVIRDIEAPYWFGDSPIYHVGWRFRPDNMWAMGPLDNLVGLQYRLDHLENLKADAMDLCVHPPLKIYGEVEEFEWGPSAEIHMDADGDVQELGKNAQWVVQAQQDIQLIENKMEAFAGAPREAMGIRTPGEKTAYEVQALQNSAGRIFQEKINTFEVELLEPILNAMLETARRNMTRTDTAKVMDDDLGVQGFMEVTKEDITATGRLRPIGARHFAAQAQLIQNLTNLGNSVIGEMVRPHTSSKQLSKLVEDVFGLERYSLFSPNIGVEEELETQSMMQQANNELAQQQAAATGGLEDELQNPNQNPQ
ncbi:portal protein [Salinivibrio phage CW02]|uniref:Portal protein n=1 Tax=Salinivibrio phage CW02 TaxID=1161935 RepID=H9D1H5_9CAUD|nr:head-tail adaptor [Salinivibrio phage CW02]AFE86217.1 portal protein [Salinivibrio phage CW02]